MAERIDMWVARFDPAGVRVPGMRSEDRRVEIGPISPGLAEISARVHSTDAAAVDRALDALADSVCPSDSRTRAQRRADALGAMAAGLTALRCDCGGADCVAAQRPPGTNVMIHLLAKPGAVSGEARAPAYLPGFGPLPTASLRDLVGVAKTKPLPLPPDRAEAGYRPSTALAEFIRFRDLTCRFPGCDAAADVCDIDHTVPFPLGPTHPSNLKLLCRHHHLLKTFYTGPDGWRDHQLPDGTVVWTSPTGHTYTTKPIGGLYFPALAVPTGTLTLPTFTPAPKQDRAVMMPARRRTRAEDHAARVRWERGLNGARIGAEAAREAERSAPNINDPPPF